MRALAPTRDELIAAARWTRQLDPSVGFKQILVECLAYFGAENVDLGA